MTDGTVEPERMLPAEAYTSAEVLAWERRHLFAGSWTCLGRLVGPASRTPGRAPSRSAPSSSATSRPCWCGTSERLRMFANTCRHRGHELLPDGETSRSGAASCAPTTPGPTTSAAR